MRNQAAVLYAPHDVRLEERPMPQVGPNDGLVEVKAVGVCGSDVHYYEHGRIGPFVVRQPLVLGHKSASVIVEVGADVPQSRIGERVAIEPGIPDGTCEQYRTGHYNLCPNVRFFGTPPIDGSFANYVILSIHFASARLKLLTLLNNHSRKQAYRLMCCWNVQVSSRRCPKVFALY
ncbi:MAG: hypothetical protein NVS4B1_14230 [Ktedonobacteraceae bacterium]